MHKEHKGRMGRADPGVSCPIPYFTGAPPPVHRKIIHYPWSRQASIDIRNVLWVSITWRTNRNLGLFCKKIKNSVTSQSLREWQHKWVSFWLSAPKGSNSKPKIWLSWRCWASSKTGARCQVWLAMEVSTGMKNQWRKGYERKGGFHKKSLPKLGSPVKDVLPW